VLNLVSLCEGLRAGACSLNSVVHVNCSDLSTIVIKNIIIVISFYWRICLQSALHDNSLQNCRQLTVQRQAKDASVQTLTNTDQRVAVLLGTVYKMNVLNYFGVCYRAYALVTIIQSPFQ